jgi:hypothetical protein
MYTFFAFAGVALVALVLAVHRNNRWQRTNKHRRIM